MSFGLGHGKPLDPALGVVGISRDELPELPDSIIDDPKSGRLDIRETWMRDCAREARSALEMEGKAWSEKTEESVPASSPWKAS